MAAQSHQAGLVVDPGGLHVEPHQVGVALEDPAHGAVVEGHREFVCTGLDGQGSHVVVDFDDAPIAGRPGGRPRVDRRYMGAVGPVEAEGHGDRFSCLVGIVSHPNTSRPTGRRGAHRLAVGVDQLHGPHQVVGAQSTHSCPGFHVGPGAHAVGDERLYHPGGRAHGGQGAPVDPGAGLAEAAHHVQIVGDHHDGAPLIAQPGEPVQTTLLEGQVADGEDLVD